MPSHEPDFSPDTLAAPDRGRPRRPLRRDPVVWLFLGLAIVSLLCRVWLLLARKG